MFRFKNRSRHAEGEAAEPEPTALSKLKSAQAEVEKLRAEKVTYGLPSSNGRMDLVEKARIVGIVNTGSEGRALEDN